MTIDIDMYHYEIMKNRMIEYKFLRSGVISLRYLLCCICIRERNNDSVEKNKIYKHSIFLPATYIQCSPSTGILFGPHSTPPSSRWVPIP